MTNFMNNIFNGHDKALMVLGRRSEVLANNIANIDTPGYKARDIDFGAVLKKESQALQATARVTHSRHIAMGDQLGINAQLKYRIPNQPSLDGNTVESQVEISKFSENALRYQATFNFLNGNIRSLMMAIRGE